MREAAFRPCNNCWKRGANLFELMLVTCIGMRYCEYLMSPIRYDSIESCSRQAAIIAGMTAGRNDHSTGIDYRYRCAPGGDGGEWYAVSRDGSVSRYVRQKSSKNR